MSLRALRPIAAVLAVSLLGALGSAVTLVVTAGPAAAHDVLVSTSPADASTVPQVPSAVVLTFDEPALAVGTDLVVTGPSGAVTVGRPRLVDNTVAQSLQPGSPAGAYTVLWRVTSVDGHPISGRFAFTATASAPGQAPTSAQASGAAIDSPGDATAPGSGTTVWIILGAGVLAVLVVVGLAAGVRRRSRG